MSRKGRTLELLLKSLQGALASEGIRIKSPEIFRDNNGRIIGEIDVTLRGMLGSMEIVSGIECRDRPADGPQARDWIREIIGKRQDLRLHKMTAVSSSGFTQGAVQLSRKEGVELLELVSMEPAKPGLFTDFRYAVDFPRIEYGPTTILLDCDDERILDEAEKQLFNGNVQFTFLITKEHSEPITIADLVAPKVKEIFETMEKTEKKSETLLFDSKMEAVFSPNRIAVLSLKVPVTCWHETYQSDFLKIGFKNVITDKFLSVSYLNQFEIDGRTLNIIVDFPRPPTADESSEQKHQFGVVLWDEEGKDFFPRGQKVSLQIPPELLQPHPVDVKVLRRSF